MGSRYRRSAMARWPTHLRARIRGPFARALSAVLVLLGTPVPARAACDPPRCTEIVVPVPRRLRVPDSTIRVLVPADYHTSHIRYPVLYLLHGAGDTFATWTDKTDVQEFTADLPVIVVMPDGGHDADAGFYSDWQDGSRQWETFHTRVLRKWIERHFRTLRGWKHRAVAGLSMGGFGAMSYSARHRHLFRAAASFSGAVDTLYPGPSNLLFVTKIVAEGVWGDPATNGALWREHNPTDRAADLREVALFVATGDGTMGGPAGDDPTNPGAYVVEQVVFQMNLSFVHALDAAGVPYTKDFYGGGYHGWPYWQRELHWALPEILAIVGPRRRG
jgi:diacylglycerol O-acyltransferase/trehalose O-mycolyltransferase